MYGDKKAIFRNYKEDIHQFISVVNLDVFVWFMKAKVCKVESCTVYLTQINRRLYPGIGSLRNEDDDGYEDFI